MHSCYTLFRRNDRNDYFFTNKIMERNRNVKNLTDTARIEETNSYKVKCLLGLLLFRGVSHDTKQPFKHLWYRNLASHPIYRACFSLKRYEWPMADTALHNAETIRKAWTIDLRGWGVWLITMHVKSTNMHHSLSLMKLLGICIFYLSSCDFKVYWQKSLSIDSPRK